MPIAWLQLVADGTDPQCDLLLVGVAMPSENLIRLTDTPPPMEWGAY